MMKANGIIIIGISVAMVITGCGNNTKEFILDGYKSCDEYFDDGFKKYTDYCKFQVEHQRKQAEMKLMQNLAEMNKILWKQT